MSQGGTGLRRVRPIAFLILGGSLASLGPSLAAPAPPTEFPLVSLHSKVKFQEVKTSLSGEDLFVTRAGTTAGDITFLADASAAFWTSLSNSGLASPPQLARLNRHLQASGAAAQRDCALTGFGGWDATYEISWYSAGAQANNFTVTVQFLPSPLPACPIAIENLLKELEAFSSQVLGLTPFSPFAQ